MTEYSDRDEWPDENLLVRYSAALERKRPSWADGEDFLNMHTEILRRMASPKWIPVDERLPEHDGEYLVYVPKRGVGVVLFFADGSDPNLLLRKKATHWQPLLEPPEG